MISIYAEKCLPLAVKEEEEFNDLLHQVGFEDVGIEATRVYRIDEAEAFLEGTGLEAEVLARELDGCVMGAFVRARKPSS